MSTTAKPMGAGAAALRVVTLVCWLLLLVNLYAVAGREAHGDAGFGHGWSWVLALLFTCLTWLFLGILLLQSAARTAWLGLLYVASGAAAVAALYLVFDPSRAWAGLIPALLPPMLAMRSRWAVGKGSLALAAAILLLSLSPWPALFRANSKDADPQVDRHREIEERYAMERERIREANLAKLRAMPADAPLTEWYSLLDEKSGVRLEALESLRRVPRRQSDIQEGLTLGIPMAMVLLPDLNLKATPALCEAARAYLRKRASELRIERPREPQPYTSQGYVAESLPGIRWLQSYGCDCGEGIEALESAVETYLDTPSRQKTLASLAELRQK